MNEGGSGASGPEHNSGSRWHRWEPHIHAPGTALNDQFTGDDAFETYLSTLENATPTVRAIAVTDYYVLDTYEAVRAAKTSGRLPDCSLIFPNVELRLGLRTIKGRFVNLHLLVCPDDLDHVDRTRRFLSQLTFEAFGDSFSCGREELIRLGRRSDPSKTTEASALEHGANQFKVQMPQLQAVYRQNDWAKANILIAVSGTETDGTSGMRDAADRTLREEMERFADVILASSPAQREFWLGQRSASIDELKSRYGGLKPCLHGSDAHSHATIAAPEGDRYSWVKGALNFDSLRQACIDPSGRAFVGATPPISAMGSQVIAKIELRGASWVQTPVVALNPGLVTIIGARGSGKTALADIIAAGCDALPATPSAASFLSRAQNRNVRSGPQTNLLAGASVVVHWHSGDVVERRIDGSAQVASTVYPRVRYLSQQFVEELCSADGMSDALLAEIERVIFEAHSLVDRDGAVTFSDLREQRTNRHRQARLRFETTLAELSDTISLELEKQRQVPVLQGQVTQKAGVIAAFVDDRAGLVTAGSEARIARLAELTLAAEKVRSNIRHFNAQRDAVLVLQDEVNAFRDFQAPAALAQAKTQHKAAALEEQDWSAFLIDYKGDVEGALSRRGERAIKAAANWRGEPVAIVNLAAPLVADDADLTQTSLAVLEAEIGRLQALISADTQVAGRFKQISTRIDEEGAQLQGLRERLDDAAKAADRLVVLREQREAAYQGVFASILAEQDVLAGLYAPLMQRLVGAAGTLGKLSFTVARTADVEAWANEGEPLFDKRGGDFQGKGTLRKYAEAALKGAWETGDKSAVSAAMNAFLHAHQATLLQHGSVPRSDEANYRLWAKRFAKWLYGTAHITLSYSIDYDGVDIRHLSPGTRGIVLLLLYLALDDADPRPLIIDQPEENLDPKSIFDELVHLFVAAKLKRQVIMVTHNANLVINTDADQIIVAHAGAHPRGQLPPITYRSGGLEEAPIRKSVCDILEGGENAFRERARRLRVRLDR